MKIVTRFLVAVLFAAGTLGLSAKTISVLIVDGQNNHNWAAMTPFMKAQLEQTGMYKVDTSSTPPRFRIPGNLPKEKREAAQKAARELNAKQWAAWRPAFAKYDVVISNYNGQDWPKDVQAAFEKYVSNVGRFICVHAANNSFPNWLGYNKMIGHGGSGSRTR